MSTKTNAARRPWAEAEPLAVADGRAERCARARADAAADGSQTERAAEHARAERADQLSHMSGSKHIFDQTVIFAQIDARASGGGDTGCILTTMLKDSQRIINSEVDGLDAQNADKATHMQLRTRLAPQ